MHADQRENAPCQLARAIGFAPWLEAPDSPQHEQAERDRHRQTQLDGQMQRQVVRVVEQHAKTLAGEQGAVVRVIELAPAPAGPRLLLDQIGHVGPQRDAARAAVRGVGHAHEQAVHLHAGPTQQQLGQQPRGQQIGQQTGHTQNQPESAHALAPEPEHHHQRHPFDRAGARRGHAAAHGQQHQQPWRGGGKNREPRVVARAHVGLLMRFGLALAQPARRAQQQRQCTHEQKRGLLIALAHVADGLAQRALVDPRRQSHIALEELHQPDHRGERARQHQPPAEAAAQLHAQLIGAIHAHEAEHHDQPTAQRTGHQRPEIGQRRLRVREEKRNCHRQTLQGRGKDVSDCFHGCAQKKARRTSCES